jgi:uncharacterized protein YaaQ
MNKKMVMAIIDDDESVEIFKRLLSEGFPVIRIDSTGGLLRGGESTLIVGLDQDEVDTYINRINTVCHPRVNPFKKRATVMVFDLEYFEQIN